MKSVRYRIQLSKHNTTITLHKIVSDLIAIKLGVTPDTSEAHHAVGKRLHELIMDREVTNKFIVEEAVLDLVGELLSEKYIAWSVQQYNDKKPIGSLQFKPLS